MSLTDVVLVILEGRSACRCDACFYIWTENFIKNNNYFKKIIIINKIIKNYNVITIEYVCKHHARVSLLVIL